MTDTVVDEVIVNDKDVLVGSPAHEKAVVKTMRVIGILIDCPYCEEPMMDFVSNPQGHDQVCEACKKTFLVAADAKIVD